MGKERIADFNHVPSGATSANSAKEPEWGAEGAEGFLTADDGQMNADGTATDPIGRKNAQNVLGAPANPPARL